MDVSFSIVNVDVFWQMLMFDFRHHNIEMACALLESCGRFLYRSPDSHYRTKIYLVGSFIRMLSLRCMSLSAVNTILCQETVNS